MSRTDEVLYSAMNSRSFVKARKEKDERQKEKARTQQELRPVGKTILEEISKERRSIANEIANLIHLEMTPEDIKSTVLGLRIADQRMITLQTTLTNLLRTPKKKTDD